MIWIPDSQNKNVQHFTEDGVIHGTVVFMPKANRYIATTNKQYLGPYGLLKNAQLAVETKHDAEVKEGL